ncbi:hypothetical protein BPOR_0421g00080 [Botrytis porri]|uniref:Uncharacterized protein n=1 Tax=Botrytis porri TaxID=87229 RepID=A0A4Z1KI55_9HELO|nr:hypothetical protein BPOR_0421g00080 [Botrytis porri]
MNTAVSDFYSLCRQMGHHPPAFIKLSNQPKNRVTLVVTVFGQQIVSSRSESSYKAAKIALAREATHYIRGDQTTWPQMVFDAPSALAKSTYKGNAVFGKNGLNISNPSAMQHQAANLAPVTHNALSADDQLYLEKHFRRNIISKMGSGTGAQVTAAADLIADFVLKLPERQTTEWHEAMRILTERPVQRLNEGSG